MKTTEYLNCMRCIVKLHESMLKTVCQRYALSNTQAAVISFLCNNPDKNTAAQIAQLRMLSKGNVSTAVDGLVEKGLLERKTDEYDRRSLRLCLLPAAEPIVRRAPSIPCADAAAGGKHLYSYAAEETPWVRKRTF